MLEILLPNSFDFILLFLKFPPITPKVIRQRTKILCTRRF